MNLKLAIPVFALCSLTSMAQNKAPFWPPGKEMALSLTWDDARASQVTIGTHILNSYDIKATFYVQPGPVSKQLKAWKEAVAAGHEIGNHSVSHPCSGNFLWSRYNALENYDLTTMSSQLEDANKQIFELLGTSPVSFAYPCGQTYVGRGLGTQSYVPVIARLFTSGRTWLDEAPNDATYCDLAQITGVEMDGKSFEELLPIIEDARKNGLWLVLAGHEINQSGLQTTQTETLEKLLQYLQKQSGIWVSTVGEISAYVSQKRKN